MGSLISNFAIEIQQTNILFWQKSIDSEALSEPFLSPHLYAIASPR